MSSMMENSLQQAPNQMETSRSVSEFDDFNYRPVPPVAPVACFFGIASSLGLVSVHCLPLGLSGLILGVFALIKIRRAEGDLGGRTLALIGFTASVLFLVSGSSIHAYAYATEVPEGYQRVNFPREISSKQFVVKDGKRELHPDVVPLIGKKVFLKGWMYQSMETEGLTEFVLLKDNGKCCFGGQPKPFDMIQVNMADGRTTRAYNGMIFVAGVIQADPGAPEGAPVYTMEVVECGLAKSAF